MNTVASQSDVHSDHKSPAATSSGSLSRTAVVLALLALVVLSFGLRLVYADGQSITFDENYEVQLAKKTVSGIIQCGDGFPPLYALTMHVWDKIVGSESGRYLSMIFAAMGVIAIYRLGAVVDSPLVGLFAAAWLAVLPIHMWYTSEIRAYSLLLLIATLALTSFLQALDSNSWKDWILFSFFTALGLHTHYLFALFPALTLLISLIFIRGIKPFAAGAMILGMTIPFALLWLEADRSMQEEYAYPRVFDVSTLAFTYGSYLLGYTLGPSRAALHDMSFVQAFLQVLPWAIAFCVCLAIIFSLSGKKIPWAKRESIVLLILAFATPLTAGLTCNELETGYNDRYAIWTVIPIVVLLGMLTRHAWTQRMGKVAMAGLLLLFAAAIFNRHESDDQRNEDLGAAAEYITSGEHEKRPVLVVSGYMVEPLKYYIDDSWSFEAIPMTSPFDSRFEEMDKILDRMKTNTKDYWLVYTREFHEDNDRRIYEMIDATSQLELVKEFAGVKIYRAVFDAQ